jgi:hypothetical protein
VTRTVRVWILRGIATGCFVVALWIALDQTHIIFDGNPYACGPTITAAFPNDPGPGETARESERASVCIRYLALRGRFDLHPFAVLR